MTLKLSTNICTNHTLSRKHYPRILSSCDRRARYRLESRGWRRCEGKIKSQKLGNKYHDRSRNTLSLPVHTTISGAMDIWLVLLLGPSFIYSLCGRTIISGIDYLVGMSSLVKGDFPGNVFDYSWGSMNMSDASFL